jgi:hypothetical protein
MLIQVLPLNIVGLAHPIWGSAVAVLGRPIAGSISIDTGATLFSLGRYWPDGFFVPADERLLHWHDLI